MIDAAIPLAGQAPQVPGGLQLLSQVGQLNQQKANLDATQQESQQRGIAMQGQSLALAGQQQSAQDQADYRASMAAAVDPTTGKVDRGTLLSTLGRLNPTIAAQTAASLTQQDAAAKDAAAKSQELQVSAAQAHLKLKDQLLQGATDPVSWANARNIAIQNGISPNELPVQYDPQFVAQAHAQTMSQQQTLDAHLAQQRQNDVEAGQAETARHDKAGEALTGSAQAQTARYQQGELGVAQGHLSLDKQKFQMEQAQSGIGSDGGNLVDAIGSGHIAPDRLGYLLSKNPGLIQGVVAKYPDFDSSKAAAYPSTFKDFTSGKTSQALNAGSTALGHMQELQQLNTVMSRVPGTEDYQKYQNKVDTLSTELAKFYGDSTVSGIANIKKTLDSTFNRDAAIRTQAQSMGDKLDAFQQTWQNAAPSKSYEAPMPGISQKALAARQIIQSGGTGTVTVQIPGSPPGHIAAEAAGKFFADHPNATVVQQ